MKKLSMFLVMIMLTTVLSSTVLAESSKYGQSPMLNKAVEEGVLPPVEDRLPEVPKIADELSAEFIDVEIGTYGGTLRTETSAVNWSAHLFMGCDENLLTQIDMTSGIITPNIVESYEANDVCTEFVFKLRKGLKWSDGIEVTMEDFLFGINDVAFNEELNPVLSSTFRTGNSATGTPMTLTVVDDTTFKVTFDSPYGGFLTRISSSAGWAGYTDTLKPAHYLKPFHIDYAEECHGSLDAFYDYIAPFAAVLGYDDPKAENVWCYVFNQIDVTNWELTDPTDRITVDTFPGLIDSNFPVLYAWIMESNANGVQTYVRNPYYWKVDEAGNQLPYIDTVLSTYVENDEIFALHVVAGQVDFSGITNAANMTFYLENEEAGNYKYISATDPANFGAISVNINYGLNADGTVKDDDASQAWQEMVSDIRFRQALMYAIDADEIVDGIYSGNATPNEYYSCNNDIKKANELLDEMGAFDVNNDGYRETPSGREFQWMMWMTADSDFSLFAELYAEFWREIGLNVDSNVTESSLLETSVQANKVPMRIHFNDLPNFWPNLSIAVDQWAPLYGAWFKAGGLTGQIAEDVPVLEPTEEIKNYYNMVYSMMEVDSNTAANVINPQCSQFMADNLYLIMPVKNCPSAISYSNDLGNVPNSGTAIVHAMVFDIERLYFENIAE